MKFFQQTGNSLERKKKKLQPHKCLLPWLTNRTISFNLRRPLNHDHFFESTIFCFRYIGVNLEISIDLVQQNANPAVESERNV